MKKLFEEYKQNGLLVFLVLYLVFYTTDAASGYFMIFLNNIGFNTLQMGVLTSGAALAAMLFQPFVGRMADRSKTKNAVLIATLLLAATACVLLRVSQAFIYIMLVYTLFLIARNILHPLVDSITLEHTAERGMDFGPIRTMGCIGYGLMSLLAGRVAAGDAADTFVLYAFTSLATIAVVCFLPKSYGMQRGKKRVNPMLIFANKQLLMYTLFAVVISSTKSYYFSFFSVYYTRDLGGSTSLYGVMLSLAAFMEIPIIFSIDKIIRRFGTRKVIIMAGMLETLRWAMTALIVDPTVAVFVQAVLGCNNMTLAIAMIMFVNDTMPPETKTTGQATYTMCTSVGSLLAGNLLGGALSNLLGIRPVFWLCVVVNLAMMALFVFVTKKFREPGRA